LIVVGWEAAAWLVAAAWVYLLVGRGWFWTTSMRLPDAPGPAPGQVPGQAPARFGWPTVTVVVPARDEAAVLPATLPSLLAQEYPGTASVVLVDDNSQDATAAVARAAAGTRTGAGAGIGTHGGLPLAVVTGAPRPAGWMGKPWALAQGGGGCGCGRAGPPGTTRVVAAHRRRHLAPA
jgi:cellulose synthase/poly-beta-1,6-N-acetylglucosamine synthase-like glycosyltransferase